MSKITRSAISQKPLNQKKENSPIRGWGGLSKMSKKKSKMSIIEFSQLVQDLFDFSDLTWAHPLTHPSTHGWGCLHKS